MKVIFLDCDGVLNCWRKWPVLEPNFSINRTEEKDFDMAEFDLVDPLQEPVFDWDNYFELTYPKSTPTYQTRKWNKVEDPYWFMDREIFPELLERVNRILEKTYAKVVLSSSWRKDLSRQKVNLRDFFKKKGLKGDVIDSTPVLNTMRGIEIQKWLDMHPEVTKFIILDDKDEAGRLGEFLLQTSPHHGIQDEHVDKAVEILGTRNN